MSFQTGSPHSTGLEIKAHPGREDVGRPRETRRHRAPPPAERRQRRWGGAGGGGPAFKTSLVLPGQGAQVQSLVTELVHTGHKEEFHAAMKISCILQLTPSTAK